MTKKEAIVELECMAINMVGEMAGLQETSPMLDILRQKVEAINIAQAALTPQNEWVSVEDRLPERGKLVIVYINGKVTVDTRLHGKTGIVGDWTIHQSLGENITHWMYMPSPPDRRPPEGEEAKV